MRFSIVSNFLTITQSSLLCFVISSSLSLFANDELPTASEVEELGLVVHWRAQTERSQVATGQAGIAIWNHTKMRNQVISIKVGERIVERITPNDVDIAATEKLVYTANGPTGTKRLGMESARELADKVISRYAKIGRKAEKIEVDQPIAYLVSASNDGAVQALNAETGEMFWSSAVGNFKLPTYVLGSTTNS